MTREAAEFVYGKKLFQSNFPARGRGKVNGLEDFLEFERLFHMHQRLLSVERATDEMMDSIFAVGDFGRVQVDGFKAIGAVAQQPNRVEAQAGGSAHQIDTMFTPLSRSEDRPARFHADGFAAFQLQQRNAEILHVKWAFGVDFALAPVKFSQPPPA